MPFELANVSCYLTDLLLCSFSILASLNLPASIEDLSGAKVPQSVLEKSAAVKEKGGIGQIDNMMQNLPELLSRNREILDEVSYRLVCMQTLN